MNASTLAASLRAFGTPEVVYRRRLRLAALAAGACEDVLSALVVGSTALRRCSDRADLDVVVVASAATGPDRFSSQVVDGVQVEVEQVSRRRALSCTAGEGWVWELREASRLGCGVPVVDPDGFGAGLARRAAAMRPRRERVESTLREVYVSLVALSGGEGDRASRADALRGCLDNLALLALLERPRRYQKPKWVLADLLDAGEYGVVDAVLAAYGIDADDLGPARAAVAGAHEVVAATFAAAGIPPRESILAMGHAPRFAEASYVSRCLDDADDLEASGRFVEAQYVAKFSARLAAGLLSDTATAGVLAAFPGDIAERYLALFEGTVADDAAVAAAVAVADARRQTLERPA